MPAGDARFAQFLAGRANLLHATLRRLITSRRLIASYYIHYRIDIVEMGLLLLFIQASVASFAALFYIILFSSYTSWRFSGR